MNSLITVHENKEHALNKMLRGISQGSEIPEEILIINIGSTPKINQDLNIPITIHQVDNSGSKNFSIGQARNLGARVAKFDRLHFLNVDCIPSDGYIERMNYFLDTCNGLIMGTPRYLCLEPSATFDSADLHKISKHHYKRPRVKGVHKTEDAELFKSLCFSIKRKNFETLGGFDHNYQDHRAEEIDFSNTCINKGMPFYLGEAIAYHQQHDNIESSQDNIESILSNCNYFHAKWHRWPMEKMLKDFADKGYISWNPIQSTPIDNYNTPDALTSNQHSLNDLPYA